MVARDIMTTEVVTIGQQARIREAADLLAAKGYSALPVVDDAGEVVGVVSYHDLIRLVLPESLDETDLSVLPPSADFFPTAGAPTALGEVRVADLMRRDELIEVSPDEPAAEIARLMVTEPIRRVVVVDGRRPLGIITRGDVVRAIVHPRIAGAAQESS